MAKGGRYLDKNRNGTKPVNPSGNEQKKQKKKGKGLKIFLVVLLVLAALIGGVLFVGNQQINEWIEKVTPAEFETKNQDKSADDLFAEWGMYEATEE